MARRARWRCTGLWCPRRRDKNTACQSKGLRSADPHAPQAGQAVGEDQPQHSILGPL